MKPGRDNIWLDEEMLASASLLLDHMGDQAGRFERCCHRLSALARGVEEDDVCSRGTATQECIAVIVEEAAQTLQRIARDMDSLATASRTITVEDGEKPEAGPRLAVVDVPG